jgi:hypothetical protein
VNSKIPLSRQILSVLGNTLHLLQKEIVNFIGVGWEAQSYFATSKELRPDSTYMEKFYLNRKRTYKPASDSSCCFV